MVDNRKVQFPNQFHRLTRGQMTEGGIGHVFPQARNQFWIPEKRRSLLFGGSRGYGTTHRRRCYLILALEIEFVIQRNSW